MLPPLVDALQRELTEGTNGSATRRREVADRQQRRQGRVGAKEAAVCQAPLLVLPPRTGLQAPERVPVPHGRLPASPADPQRWRRRPARVPHGRLPLHRFFVGLAAWIREN